MLISQFRFEFRLPYFVGLDFSTDFKSPTPKILESTQTPAEISGVYGIDSDSMRIHCKIVSKANNTQGERKTKEDQCKSHNTHLFT